MEAAPEFKNESQERLALIATLQSRENENLRRRLAELSGEAFHQETLLIEQLRKEAPQIAPTQAKRKSKVKTPKKGHGPTEQARLECLEEVFLLDAPDQTCPSCGANLAEWTGQFECADLVDVVEKIYYIKKVKRQKYRCDGKDCNHIETALGPRKIVKGRRYSVDFAVDVASEKYVNHMPLERQVRSMQRLGLKVKSQTLWECEACPALA